MASLKPHHYESDSERLARERDQRAHPYSGRGVTAVLGPTNTGKTHLAIERMIAHPSGIIGLPLRLLAREVYTRLVERVGEGAVALITGEEKIQPVGARYSVCTVEAMPRATRASFVAIDEVQLAGDLSRGHVFTDRLLHLRGLNETLLLGAATMRGILTKLLPGLSVVTRPRLSHLAYSGSKKITRLPRRSAIVAFSADEVYAIAELIRRQRGGAAVVLGALSPRTRNAQVELFQHGDVDFLVATDAIGMGLNLDLDHVAFAQDHKFDGFQTRPLTPAEMGQIAGRAGRHVRDGTFGVTSNVPPFEDEAVQRIEAHDFAPVRTLQWRSPTHDFRSLDALRRSVEAPPEIEGLARALPAHDVRALEILAREDSIQRLATKPDTVRLLWEACALPDYRRIAPAQHAELIEQMYKDLVRLGHVDEEFMAAQVARADRTDGEIDTLSARIAQIRTWTFVSHRPNWLRDPAHWQGVTREIEDRLSDALHERLTKRFVDRRTSVLMRRLRENAVMEAEIGVDGEVVVEGHAVGQLEGFRFRPDASAGGADAKAVAAASARALALEFEARAARLAASPNRDFALGTDAVVRWQGQVVARLAAGDDPLRPRVILLADEQLTGPARDKVANRIERHVRHQIETHLKPLLDLTGEPASASGEGGDPAVGGKRKPSPAMAATFAAQRASAPVAGVPAAASDANGQAVAEATIPSSNTGTDTDAPGADPVPGAIDGPVADDLADRVAPERTAMADGSDPIRTDGAAAEGALEPQPDGAATLPPDGAGGADGVEVASVPTEPPVMEGMDPTPATMDAPADPGVENAATAPSPDAGTPDNATLDEAVDAATDAIAAREAAGEATEPVAADAVASGEAVKDADGTSRDRRRGRKGKGGGKGSDQESVEGSNEGSDAQGGTPPPVPTPARPQQNADELTGMARGLAFRLAEAMGVLPRREVADEVRGLDQSARAGLRKRGVRFGFYHVFVPALLKPAPAELATMLWALNHDKLDAPGYGEVVPLLASGRTSVVVDPAFERDFYRLAGFRVMGGRAVRIDILERLADIIRPAVQWSGKGKRPEAGYDGQRFVTTPGMMSILGAKEDDLTVILKALGYRSERVPVAEVEARLAEIDGPRAEGPEGVAVERRRKRGRKEGAGGGQTTPAPTPDETGESNGATGPVEAATAAAEAVAADATDAAREVGGIASEAAESAGDLAGRAASAAIEAADGMAGAVLDAVVAPLEGATGEAGEGATASDGAGTAVPEHGEAGAGDGTTSIAPTPSDGTDGPGNARPASSATDGVEPAEEATVLLWRQGPPPGARQRHRGGDRRNGEGRRDGGRRGQRDGEGGQGRGRSDGEGGHARGRDDARGKGGKMGKGGGKPDGKGGKRRDERSDRPPRRDGRPPRREPDPDSPFAALAALKGQLKK